MKWRCVCVPLQITCIAVDERQSLMAAGFVGGMVVLIKGNLVRYWSSRQQVLPFCLDNPITGVLVCVHTETERELPSVLH